jgi:hypothetical protein
MKDERTRILLVGSRVTGPSFVHGLTRLRYECRALDTLGEAMELLKSQHFHLVLAQVRLQDGSGSTLIGPVVGKGGDLYLQMVVQNGSLWLPAVRNGHDCWGAAALKPGELKRQLVSAAHREPASPSRFLPRRVLSPLTGPSAIDRSSHGRRWASRGTVHARGPGRDASRSVVPFASRDNRDPPRGILGHVDPAKARLLGKVSPDDVRAEKHGRQAFRAWTWIMGQAE